MVKVSPRQEYEVMRAIWGLVSIVFFALSSLDYLAGQDVVPGMTNPPIAYLIFGAFFLILALAVQLKD